MIFIHNGDSGGLRELFIYICMCEYIYHLHPQNLPEVVLNYCQFMALLDEFGTCTWQSRELAFYCGALVMVKKPYRFIVMFLIISWVVQHYCCNAVTLVCKLYDVSRTCHKSGGCHEF